MSPSSSTPSTESLFRLGLNATLPVSEEATTSRVVVNNEILRTVVFTFDAGQVLTEHSSPRAVIVTLLEGEMDFSGESIVVDANGDVIAKADDTEGILYAEVDLAKSSEIRSRRTYTGLRRTELYK